jgi:S-formylglutathione hydrolase FrmB
VPFIHDDLGGPQDIAVTGPSFVAYHAANLALKRADLFPLAICQSGIYEVSSVGWGELGTPSTSTTRPTTATTWTDCAGG